MDGRMGKHGQVGSNNELVISELGEEWQCWAQVLLAARHGVGRPAAQGSQSLVNE